MCMDTFLFWTLILFLMEEHSRIKMDTAHFLLYMQGLAIEKQY